MKKNKSALRKRLGGPPLSVGAGREVGAIERFGPRLLLAIATTSFAGLALIVYWPFVGDFFALDDYIWLRAASDPDASRFFRRAFSFPPGQLLEVPTPFWRPLIDFYFFSMWRVNALDPTPYHLVNVVLHGLIAGLVSVLTWQLSGSRVAGLGAGALFVVLPTYSFAVTWISSVTELLAAFFYLLTIALFLEYRRTNRGVLYCGAFAALLMALLSKESAVTLPLILAGAAFLAGNVRNRQEVFDLLRSLFPFVALTFAYFVLVFTQEYGSAADGGLYRLGWHVWRNLWEYLTWMVIPIPDESASWIHIARPYAATLFLAGGLAFAVARAWIPAFLVLWTIVSLLPYSFFPAGIEQRYTYFASIPFSILTMLVADGLLRRAQIVASERILFSAAGLILVMVTLFLASESRQQQEWLSMQGESYRQLFHQVPEACGDLPPESHIYLLGTPAFDLFGASTRMALNIQYDRVFVSIHPDGRLPELAGLIEDRCVVTYAD